MNPPSLQSVAVDDTIGLVSRPILSYETPTDDASEVQRMLRWIFYAGATFAISSLLAIAANTVWSWINRWSFGNSLLFALGVEITATLGALIANLLILAVCAAAIRTKQIGRNTVAMLTVVLALLQQRCFALKQIFFSTRAQALASRLAARSPCLIAIQRTFAF